MTLRLTAFFFCLFMLLNSGQPPWTDSHIVYDTTQALVDRGELNIHINGLPQYFVTRADGRKYSVYPLGPVLAMAPSYVAYKLLRHIPGMPDRWLFAFTCHFSSAALMAGTMALFFRLCRRRAVDATSSFLGATALGLSTLCFVYARSPYSEALQTFALLWTVERTVDQGEKSNVAGLCWLAVAAGVLIHSKLVYAVVLPISAAYLLYCHRQQLGPLLRQLPFPALIFSAFVALMMWHNHIKTGSLFDSGYHSEQSSFSGDFWTGFYGFTLSSGRGIFFYSPPLLLGLMGVATSWRRRRIETLLVVSIISLLTLLNSKYLFWHAGWCWGPRYLVPITPLLFLLAFPWLPEALARGRRHLRRVALAALLGLGVTVQVLGAAFYWDTYIRALLIMRKQTGADGWGTDNPWHGDFIPGFSPIRGHYWMLKHLLMNDPDLDRDPPWKIQVPQKTDLREVWGRMGVDWWLLDIRQFGRGPAAAFPVLFLGGAIASGVTIRRRLDLAGEKR